ncbi:MAG: fibro-slime domain-containing protein [Planctomycetota bacterium]|jgi:fibro-slime domain-containing protein
MSAVRIPAARGAVLAVCVGAIAVLSQPAVPAGGNNGNNGNGDDRDTIELIGVVRDFLPSHPDFDVVPPQGYGHYMWNVATEMNEDDRPVFVGGGYKVLSQAHDAMGRPICWTLCDPDAGDTPAEPDNPDTGSITSAETFDEWFRDIPGINLSALVTLTGVMQEDGEYEGLYEVNIPQFYPIDGMLLGNGSDEHNHFFTFTIAAEFTHDASAGYVLMFKSDDDAYIFLEDPAIPDGGRMIGDLGGINGSPEQWVDLNRLGMVNGETYRIHFFKANRSNASSRLHLLTNVPFTSQPPPTILAAFD